jgi:hypothetical protein
MKSCSFERLPERLLSIGGRAAGSAGARNATWWWCAGGRTCPRERTWNGAVSGHRLESEIAACVYLCFSIPLPWRSIKKEEPWRCGIVVIVSSYRTEDYGFESRQGVRISGIYTLQCCYHNLMCIVIVCTWEKLMRKNLFLKKNLFWSLVTEMHSCF